MSTNLPNDISGWVTALMGTVTTVAVSWGYVKNKTAERDRLTAEAERRAAEGTRKDRDDWQRRVELRDVEITDEKNLSASLQRKVTELSDTLSHRPDINHIMVMLKEERDDASKRHEQIIGEFKTQMDISNRRSEQFHEAQLKALVCIQEGLTALNNAAEKRTRTTR